MAETARADLDKRIDFAAIRTRLQRHRNPDQTTACPVCGTKFLQTPLRKTCSNSCRTILWRARREARLALEAEQHPITTPPTMETTP